MRPVMVEVYCLGGAKMGFSTDVSVERLRQDMTARLPESVVDSACRTIQKQLDDGSPFPNVVFFLAAPVGIGEFMGVSKKK